MSRGMRAEGATMWRERRTAGGNANAVLGRVLTRRLKPSYSEHSKLLHEKHF